MEKKNGNHYIIKKVYIGGLYRITPILYRVVLMESSCAPYLYGGKVYHKPFS